MTLVAIGTEKNKPAVRALTEEGSRLVAAGVEFLDESRSKSTRAAYSTDWAQFESWCASVGAVPLPASPVTIAGWIAALAERGSAASTVSRKLAAIAYVHKRARVTSPTADPDVQDVLAGFRRSRGVAPKKAKAATSDIMRQLLAVVDAGTLVGKRDRALLLIGFFGGVRSSELISFRVSDMREHPQGLVLNIKRSKTDQDGAGRDIFLPRQEQEQFCPCAALQDWLSAAGITEGWVLRGCSPSGTSVLPGRLSRRSCVSIMNKVSVSAGLGDGFSPHSLRAGMISQAALNGCDLQSIMSQSGHKNPATVMGYIRIADPTRGNAVMTLSI